MSSENTLKNEENVNCRAKAIGGTGLVDCLCEGTICQYAMPFGYTHLCNHPDKHTIADASKAETNKTESGQ